MACPWRLALAVACAGQAVGAQPAAPASEGLDARFHSGDPDAPDGAEDPYVGLGKRAPPSAEEEGLRFKLFKIQGQAEKTVYEIVEELRAAVAAEAKQKRKDEVKRQNQDKREKRAVDGAKRYLSAIQFHELRRLCHQRGLACNGNGNGSNERKAYEKLVLDHERRQVHSDMLERQSVRRPGEDRARADMMGRHIEGLKRLLKELHLIGIKSSKPEMAKTVLAFVRSGDWEAEAKGPGWTRGGHPFLNHFKSRT